MRIYKRLNIFIKILKHKNRKKKGYIYIRYHYSYDNFDCYKIGKASCIPDRDSQYATSEIIRGHFIKVFEVPYKQMNFIERSIQHKFEHLNVRYNGGTEFYKKNIINLINPYLTDIGICFRELSANEIANLCRTDKINTESQNNKYEEIQQPIQQLKQPRPDQIAIIEKSLNHFESESKEKGLLVVPCGTGKTLIALWIASELITKQHNKTIVIGVPNKLLLKQWSKSTAAIFPNIPQLLVSGCITIDNIIQFLQKNCNKCIIITTYASANKVYSATQQINFCFHFKINDEAHHLTTNAMKTANTSKTYIQMLNISSTKQLSLTATLKYIECNNQNNSIISNDDVAHFGEVIERKCLLWAITEGIICDYIIQTIITDDEELNKFNILATSETSETIGETIGETVIETYKRLLLSAYAALRSIYNGHTHHILIYANNRQNAMKVIEYIKFLLDEGYFVFEDLYFSGYFSEMKAAEQREIIRKFESAKFGIIACVYCLGEGWDFPLLDGVLFAEPMTSNIRIVQSALRASRKNSNEPNKITKIILPLLNKGNWLDDNSPDFKKVREVIYQMGLEDETITQKLKVSKMSIPQPADNNRVINESSSQNERAIEIECDEELTAQLRLKTVKRIALDITFEKAKKILSTKGLKTKQEYYELCEKDDRLTKEPEHEYKDKFTNWVDYLGMENIYYDIETCKDKLTNYVISKSKIGDEFNLGNIAEELREMDNMFPPCDLWCDYYRINNIASLIKVKVNTDKIEF